MRVLPTVIEGVSIVETEPSSDDRGYFERIFSDEDFRRLALPGSVTQCAISHNRARGTLRGLHYQTPPHSETKLVRCLKGVIHDVALDLRTLSPTYGHSVGVVLSEHVPRALYIAAGCAHGFLTLSNDVTLLYCIGGQYVPDAARVVRWNDPAFKIAWPFQPSCMSFKDREACDYRSP